MPRCRGNEKTPLPEKRRSKAAADAGVSGRRVDQYGQACAGRLNIVRTLSAICAGVAVATEPQVVSGPAVSTFRIDHSIRPSRALTLVPFILVPSRCTV